GRARRIDAVGDGAERLPREVRDRPLGTRIADDGHGASALDAEARGETVRHRGDAHGELPPRRLAIDTERLGAKRNALRARARTLDEQAGQGRRAEAAPIHRGLAILRRGAPRAEGRIVESLMATDAVVDAVKRVGLTAGARVV